MKRQRVRIDSLYSGLYDGPHATPKPSDDGPIFLGIGNITVDGQLDLSSVRHIAEQDFPSWTKRVVPKPGDIVLTYEATLNRYAIIPDGFRGCLGRRLALIRPDERKVNTRFLFFYFFGEDWRRTIRKNTLSGATVDRIPLTALPSFEIDLLPRPAQDRISSILSAYDDLIENNTRRYKLLEQMAQMLYQEWFVNFRFPGHEKIKMVESELGPIPTGWSVRSLDSMMDFQGGSQPPKSEWCEEPRPGYVRMIQIRDYESDNHVGYVKDLKQLRKCSELDVMIARYGASVARICWGLNGAYNVALVRVVPLILNLREFLRSFLSSEALQSLLIGMSGRTAQAGFNKSILQAIKTPFPSDGELLQRYEEIAGSIRQLELTLKKANKNLKITRDLLLPRLVSGEVSVEQLESEAIAQNA